MGTTNVNKLTNSLKNPLLSLVCLIETFFFENVCWVFGNRFSCQFSHSLGFSISLFFSPHSRCSFAASARVSGFLPALSSRWTSEANGSLRLGLVLLVFPRFCSIRYSVCRALFAISEFPSHVKCRHLDRPKKL